MPHAADEEPAGQPAASGAAAAARDDGDAASEASLEDGIGPAVKGTGLSRWHDDEAAEAELNSVSALSGCHRLLHDMCPGRNTIACVKPPILQWRSETSH